MIMASSLNMNACTSHLFILNPLEISESEQLIRNILRDNAALINRLDLLDAEKRKLEHEVLNKQILLDDIVGKLSIFEEQSQKLFDDIADFKLESEKKDTLVNQLRQENMDLQYKLQKFQDESSSLNRFRAVPNVSSSSSCSLPSPERQEMETPTHKSREHELDALKIKIIEFFGPKGWELLNSTLSFIPNPLFMPQFLNGESNFSFLVNPVLQSPPGFAPPNDIARPPMPIAIGSSARQESPNAKRTLLINPQSLQLKPSTPPTPPISPPNSNVRHLANGDDAKDSNNNNNNIITDVNRLPADSSSVISNQNLDSNNKNVSTAGSIARNVNNSNNASERSNQPENLKNIVTTTPSTTGALKISSSHTPLPPPPKRIPLKKANPQDHPTFTLLPKKIALKSLSIEQKTKPIESPPVITNIQPSSQPRALLRSKFEIATYLPNEKVEEKEEKSSPSMKKKIEKKKIDQKTRCKCSSNNDDGTESEIYSLSSNAQSSEGNENDSSDGRCSHCCTASPSKIQINIKQNRLKKLNKDNDEDYKSKLPGLFPLSHSCCQPLTFSCQNQLHVCSPVLNLSQSRSRLVDGIPNPCCSPLQHDSSPARDVVCTRCHLHNDSSVYNNSKKAKCTNTLSLNNAITEEETYRLDEDEEKDVGQVKTFSDSRHRNSPKLSPSRKDYNNYVGKIHHSSNFRLKLENLGISSPERRNRSYQQELVGKVNDMNHHDRTMNHTCKKRNSSMYSSPARGPTPPPIVVSIVSPSPSCCGSARRHDKKLHDHKQYDKKRPDDYHLTFERKQNSTSPIVLHTPPPSTRRPQTHVSSSHANYDSTHALIQHNSSGRLASTPSKTQVLVEVNRPLQPLLNSFPPARAALPNREPDPAISSNFVTFHTMPSDFDDLLHDETPQLTERMQAGSRLVHERRLPSPPPQEPTPIKLNPHLLMKSPPPPLSSALINGRYDIPPISMSSSSWQSLLTQQKQLQQSLYRDFPVVDSSTRANSNSHRHLNSEMSSNAAFSTYNTVARAKKDAAGGDGLSLITKSTKGGFAWDLTPPPPPSFIPHSPPRLHQLINKRIDGARHSDNFISSPPIHLLTTNKSLSSLLNINNNFNSSLNG